MKAAKTAVWAAIFMVCLQFTVYAQTGFSAQVDIDANLVQFFHQDVKNDTYIQSAVLPRTDSVYFMRNSDYDVKLDFNYTDPNGLYGGKIKFDVKPNADKPLNPEDIYGWIQISPFFRGKIGVFTDRVIEKVGGDKDLGVLLFGPAGNDLVIATSDSLGLGSGAIGFIPSAIAPLGPLGELTLSGFFAPNEYYLAQIATPPGINPMPVTIPAYATYKFGGSVKYVLPEWFTIAAAYRITHTKSESGVDLGRIFHDFGIYGIVTPHVFSGLKAGIGYSGRLDYREEEDRDKEIHKPWRHAFHLDFKYEGIPGLPNLSLGLYNNISLHLTRKEETENYVAAVDQANPDIYGNEFSIVVYNEFQASYIITDKLMPSLTLRNYYANLGNAGGQKENNYAKNIFMVEVLAQYIINSKAKARAGLKFEVANYGTPIASEVLQNSSQGVSFPIGITILW